MIVVGAGSGLGQATALTLNRAGLTVVAVDRSEAGLKQLPDEIHREVADVTDPAVPRPLVNRIAAEVGPPSILANTIGAFELGDVLSVTAESLRQLMDVNLGAALWLTQAVAPHMQEKGSGVIVHITARFGVEPTAGYAAYGVSKAASCTWSGLSTSSFAPTASGSMPSRPRPSQLRRTRSRSRRRCWQEPSSRTHRDVIAFLVSDAAAPLSGAVVPTYG